MTLAQEGGTALHGRREGARCELSLLVQVGAGWGNYGTLALDPMALRRLIRGLQDELHQMERAQALEAAGGQ